MKWTGIIYLVTGKKYVGRASSGLHKRWQRHLDSAKAGSPAAIHKAIRKYGEAKFRVFTIEVLSTWDDLIHREKFWIREFESFGPRGYNLTAGGEGAEARVWSEESKKTVAALTGLKYGPQSEDHRKKIADASKRHFRSKENRRKHRDAVRAYWASHKRKFTPEYRKNLGKAALSYWQRGGPAVERHKMRLRRAQARQIKQRYYA
jgi:group I intron endonuclease